MKILASTLAIAIALSAGSVVLTARADDAMKADAMKKPDAMMADCMKKADMDTDAMMKKQKKDDCSHKGGNAMMAKPKG